MEKYKGWPKELRTFHQGDTVQCKIRNEKKSAKGVLLYCPHIAIDDRYFLKNASIFEPSEDKIFIHWFINNENEFKNCKLILIEKKHFGTKKAHRDGMIKMTKNKTEHFVENGGKHERF